MREPSSKTNTPKLRRGNGNNGDTSVSVGGRNKKCPDKLPGHLKKIGLNF
jgi:hypothetical protein